MTTTGRVIVKMKNGEYLRKNGKIIVMDEDIAEWLVKGKTKLTTANPSKGWQICKFNDMFNPEKHLSMEEWMSHEVISRVRTYL